MATEIELRPLPCRMYRLCARRRSGFSPLAALRTAGALGEALGLTFQQVQKYEKGMNRISPSRMQQISEILEVPVAFFFEDAPGADRLDRGAPSVTYVEEFVTNEDGLGLANAFTRIESGEIRRRIVGLVDAIAPSDAE